MKKICILAPQHKDTGMKVGQKLELDALIVDDDAGVREIIFLSLEELNFFKHIICATDGVDAFRKVTNQRFDLIVLDLNMPKMDGQEFVKVALNKDPSLAEKMIVISGEINKESLRFLSSKGLRHFLVKPYQPEDLRRTILKITNR